MSPDSQSSPETILLAILAELRRIAEILEPADNDDHPLRVVVDNEYPIDVRAVK